MKKETLIKDLLLLTQAFPGVDFSIDIYWEVLSGVDDDSFSKAVLEFIKTRKEIYPGTGPIAILHERAIEFYKQKLESQKTIADERSDPPPPEWHKLKESLKK